MTMTSAIQDAYLRLLRLLRALRALPPENFAQRVTILPVTELWTRFFEVQCLAMEGSVREVHARCG